MGSSSRRTGPATAEERVSRRVALRRTNHLTLSRQSGSASVTVLCECGESCGKWLHLEADEYEAASTRGRHVLAPGHQSEGDRVIRERRAYVVVEGSTRRRYQR